MKAEAVEGHGLEDLTCRREPRSRHRLRIRPLLVRSAFLDYPYSLLIPPSGAHFNAWRTAQPPGQPGEAGFSYDTPLYSFLH